MLYLDYAFYKFFFDQQGLVFGSREDHSIDSRETKCLGLDVFSPENYDRDGFQDLRFAT
jgi:hypothetical protein